MAGAIGKFAGGRLATLLKKASELETLCDIDVCVVCFDPSGQVSTWPEKKADVAGIIQRYRSGSASMKRSFCSDESAGTAKKRKTGSDLRDSAADAIPRFCDREAIYAIPRSWLSEDGTRLGIGDNEWRLVGSDESEIGTDCVDRKTEFVSTDEIGIDRCFSSSSSSSSQATDNKPEDGDLGGQVNALDSLIERIRALEEKKQIEVEEQQSQAGEFGFEFEDTFWNELPQLDRDHDHFTSNCFDFGTIDLNSVNFY